MLRNLIHEGAQSPKTRSHKVTRSTLTVVVDGVALLLHLVRADEQLQVVLLEEGLRVVGAEAEPHASLGRRAALLRVRICGCGEEWKKKGQENAIHLETIANIEINHRENGVPQQQLTTKQLLHYSTHRTRGGRT